MRLQETDMTQYEKQQEKHQPLTDADKTLRHAEKRVKSYQMFLIRLIVLILFIWVLFFFVVGITKMPNEDMAPRIQANNTLIFFRLDKTPVKDDVMIYDRYVDNERKTYIGRVIAVAGDTVEITESGRVVVNGNALLEPNIYSETTLLENVDYPVKLKDGEYFVLADRRGSAIDSRYFGPITKKDTVGTVLISINRNSL